MNFIGLSAVVLSLAAFTWTYRLLRERSFEIRLGVRCGMAALAAPSVLFALYYLHVLPERAWFYTMRSWPGTEFLVVFLGCAGGAFASILPRSSLVVPLFFHWIPHDHNPPGQWIKTEVISVSWKLGPIFKTGDPQSPTAIVNFLAFWTGPPKNVSCVVKLSVSTRRVVAIFGKLADTLVTRIRLQSTCWPVARRRGRSR